MSHHKPRAVNDGRKDQQAPEIRIQEIPVRRLRHIFSTVDLSSRCLSHVAADRPERSEMGLQQMLPLVFEDENGELHPAGYASHTAALLAYAGGDLLIPVVVSKRVIHKTPSAIDLAMDINLKVSEIALAEEINKALQYLRNTRGQATAIMVADFIGLHPSKLSRHFKDLFK